MKATITLLEASDLTGVSRRSLYYWMRWGWLPFRQVERPEASPHRRVQLVDVQGLRDRQEFYRRPRG